MSDNGLTELLKESIVRLEIGGRPNGTGFFASPAHIVTCAHVIEPWQKASPFSRPPLTISDAHGKQHEIVDIKSDIAADLSLIQLGTADTTVAVALLNDAVEANHPLWTFGFTEPHPEGVPATFTAEGTSGAPTNWIKFQQGQAQAGMSGAPVLNLSTGTVCGVMKRSRGVEGDLGGYAIRTSTLFAAFEDLPALNAAAHAGESGWIGRLDPEQRRRVQRRVTAETDYVEFVVLIDQEDDDWRVTATTHPAGEVVASVRVDLNCVRKEVPRLFRAWKSHGRMNDTDQAQLLGRVLYRSILPGPLGAELERLAFADKRPVHISLCFAEGMDDDLRHLPWEQLYVDGRPGVLSSALGATAQLTLSRVFDPEPAGPATDGGAGSCSVLIVADPAAAPAAGRLAADLKRIPGMEPAETDVRMTLDDVEHHVNNGGVTVLHYIGHGRYEQQQDQIALSGEDGEPEYFSGGELAQMLRLQPPRVVVLQAYSTPDVVPADPTVLAAPLLDSGVEAVIAFPFPLRPDDAAAYAQKLYTELAEGQTVRVAVQKSRRRLPPWSRPALLMGRPADATLVGRMPSGAKTLSWGGGHA